LRNESKQQVFRIHLLMMALRGHVLGRLHRFLRF
jgi:hypothetical protein